MIKYKYFVLLYMLQDVILERKKKTKKINLSRLEVTTKSKSRLQQVWRGRSGRIREKSRLSKPTHGWSSCGNTKKNNIQYSILFDCSNFAGRRILEKALEQAVWSESDIAVDGHTRGDEGCHRNRNQTFEGHEVN